MLKEIEVPYPGESLVAREIAAQPDLWPTTLERIQSATLTPLLKNLPVIVTGAGTSAYAAMAVAEAWPGAAAIPTTDLLLQSADEIRCRLPRLAEGGLLLSLARSGDSPESAGVVERISKLFPAVQHVAILCNAEGRLARTAGVQAICLDPRTNDRSLAMTSSFSNLVLGGLCLLHQKEIRESLPAICSRVASSLQEVNAVTQEIAQVCKDRIIFLTSSMHGLAREACIKVVELTAGRVMPMPETFLGVRHGPLSFSRPDTPIVCFASSDKSKRPYEKDLLDELRSRGLGKLVLIGDEETSTWPHDWRIQAAAPELPDSLRTPFEVPVAQLLAYHLSVHAAINPDNPSPGDVVTRVVREFRIHTDAT